MASIQAGSTTGKRPYAVLTVTETSTSVSNNSSTISYKLVLKRPSPISSSAKKTWSCTINGKKISGSGAIGGSGDKTLLSGTMTVIHNDDGKKSITIACSITLDITWGSTHLGTISNSGNMTLSIIPRNSQVTLNTTNATIGDTITVYTNSKSSAFHYKISYKLEGNNWILIDENVNDSLNWTIPNSFIDLITNSDNANVTIESDCYNGDSKVGSSTARLKVNVPYSIIPIIDSVSIVEGEKGLNDKFGAYIRNQSTLKIDIKASGVRGSMIQSYSTQVEGITYISNSIVTNTLKGFGKLDVIVTVKDTRGRTTSKSMTVNVIDYKDKVISVFDVERCTVEGIVDETDGINVAIKFAYDIDPIANKNDSAYQLQYFDGVSWNDLVISTGYSKDETYVSSTTFDADKDFNFRIAVTDFFGTYYAYDSITPTFTLINFHENGRHLAFCGISNKEAIQFYDDICLEKNRIMKADSSFLNIDDISINGHNHDNRYAIKNHNHDERYAPLNHLHKNKILWSGEHYPLASQTLILKEKISQQTNGIVVVFSRYSGAAGNYGWHEFFISKELVKQQNGNGHNFFMCTTGFGIVASKYLYIYDDKIVGDDQNSEVSSGSGISYKNNQYVLRYIIGV